MSVPNDMTLADAAEFFYGLGMRLNIEFKEMDSVKKLQANLEHTASGWRPALDEREAGRQRERATARALRAQNELYSRLVEDIELLELRAHADQLQIESLQEQIDEMRFAAGQAPVSEPPQPSRKKAKPKRTQRAA